MTSEKLTMSILSNLGRIEYGISLKTLQATVEINLNRADITTEEFEKEIESLKNRGLIEEYRNLMDNRFYRITELGKAALKGL